MALNLFSSLNMNRHTGHSKLVNPSKISGLPNDYIMQLDNEAIVHETIFPRHRGWVQFRSTWWSARCNKNVTILVGEVVYVLGIQGNTLLVEPVMSEEVEHSESLN